MRGPLVGPGDRSEARLLYAKPREERRRAVHARASCYERCVGSHPLCRSLRKGYGPAGSLVSTGIARAKSGATILAFPTHQYTVEVVYRIREMLDILDARTVDVNVR